MKLLCKLAYRELYNNRKFSFFFTLTLFVGLLGFAILTNLQSSINQYMGAYANTILAADLKFSTNFKLTTEEVSWLQTQLPKNTEQSQTISFLSMVSSSNNSKLVRVTVIDNNFPLYGEFTFQSNNPNSSKITSSDLNLHNHTWVQPELAQLLQLQKGSNLQLGKTSFIVSNVVKDAPGQGLLNIDIAYNVYIGKQQLAATKLLQKGSRQSYSYLFKLPPKSNISQIAKKISHNFETKFPTRSFRLRTAQNANQRTDNMLVSLTRYLGLLALVALFLAGMGMAYLFHGYLNSRKKEIAIFVALGYTKIQAILILIIQITFLAFGASVLAMLFSLTLIPFIIGRLAYFLPPDFHFTINPFVFFFVFAIAIVGSFTFIFPLLWQVKQYPINALFQKISIVTNKKTKFISTISYLPLLLFYELLSVIQVRSFYIGSLFTIVLFAAIACSVILGLGLLYIVSLWKRQPVAIMFIFRRWQRNKIAFLAIFTSLSIGSLLLNFMPLLAVGLTSELQTPDSIKLPSLFLFDIQKEELSDLQSWLSKQGATLSNTSVMVPAKLHSINGVSVATIRVKEASTKEEKEQKWFATRDYWLSERNTLYDSEKIEKGHWFTKEKQKIPAISIDSYFAERMHVSIGDILTFTIDGVSVKGKIANFRRIRWNSFQPNFFIVFQPPVLTQAPGSYLASLSNISKDKRLALQTNLIKKFPTISVLDVTYIIKKILTLLAAILLIISTMSYISILVGLLVVYAITFYETEQRKQEANLMKVLGASTNRMYAHYITEFGLLALLCSVFGLILSFFASYLIADLFFTNVIPKFSITLLYNLSMIIIIIIFTSLFSIYRVLRSKPSTLFSEFSALS